MPPAINTNAVKKARTMVLVLLAVIITGIAIVGGGHTLSGFSHDI